MEPELFLLIMVVSLATSYVNMMIGGGGGLVIVPFLIFLGLSPQMAVATGISSFITATISATYRFWKGNQIAKEYLIPFFAFGGVGALLGAFLLVNISATIIEKMIGVALLLVVPLTFLREFGLERRKTSFSSHGVGWVFLFCGCLFAALTGGGGGLFVVYTAVFFFGLTFIQANASAAPLWFLTNIFLAIFFFSHDLISIPHAIPLMAGNLIGAYLGAHTAIMKGNRFVRSVFSVVVIVLAIKLLFF